MLTRNSRRVSADYMQEIKFVNQLEGLDQLFLDINFEKGSGPTLLMKMVHYYCAILAISPAIQYI